jgi:hypothetical protein
MIDGMHEKTQSPRQAEEEQEELVLCVGNPPALRDLLSLGRARVVVIPDLDSVRPFMAKRRVSRILVDLPALVRESL